MAYTELILTELTELGFTNPKRETVDDTAEAIFQQLDDEELGVRMVRVLSEYAALGGLCKDNYEEVLEDWVFDKAGQLHGVSASFPYM